MKTNALAPKDAGIQNALSNVHYIDLRHESGDSVILPDVTWLTSAKFHRMGPDLVLESPGGEKIFLIGYFQAGTPHHIEGAGGASLPAHIINILAGPRAAQQVAQAVETDAAEPIGTVETLKGSVNAIRVDGTLVELKQGDPIFQGDTIETGEKGVVGITFADDSTMSLDENGRIVIDELVYDPGNDEGSASMFVLQGAMSFVSGQLAKVNPDAVQISTPVATIGIRGTSIVLNSSTGADGKPNMAVAMMPEVGPDGQVLVGEAVVSTGSSSQILSKIMSGLSVTDPAKPLDDTQTISLKELSHVFGGVLNANPNRNTIPDNVRNVVQKVVQLKQTEDRKADLESRIEEAKANGEDTAELEGQLEQTNADLDAQTQEAEAAIDEVAQEFGDPDLAKDSNLTGQNETGDQGQEGPQENPVNNDIPTPPTPTDTPPPPPIGVIPPVPPEPIPPVPPKPIPPEPEPDPPLPEPTNESPSALNDSLTVTADKSKEFSLDALLDNDSDPDGDTLTVTQIAGQAFSAGTSATYTLTHGTLNYDGNKFTFTPDTSYVGTAGFDYTISDGQGGAATAKMEITVEADVDPVVSGPTSFNVDEGTALTITKTALLANASDANVSDTLSISNLSVDNGTLVDNGDGTWTFTPDVNFTGSVNLTYDVSDDGGSTLISATGTIDVAQVFGPADIPVNTLPTGTDPANDTTNAVQNVGVESDVAMLADGGWLVTWTDNGHDGSVYGIYGQRFNADGSPNGEQFLVNSQTSQYQQEPTTLQLDNGDIIIAWGVGNGSSSGAFAQRYDANMVPQGVEFKLNETNINYSGQPELVDLGGGSFGVTYRLELSGVPLTDYSDIFYREFDASNIGGSQVVVNTNNYMQHQMEPEIAKSGSNVLVVWAETSGNITNGIYGRIYDTSVPSWGTDFSIATTGTERNARIETLGSGKFIVTYTVSGVDGDGTAIQGQLLNSDGTLSGSTFQINTTATGNQTYSDVTALNNGNFVVVWNGPGDNPADSTDQGIWGQIFDATGAKVGTEFLINENYQENQVFPDITTLSDGDFVVSWSDESMNTASADIMMKRFNQDGTVDETAVPLHEAPVLTMNSGNPPFTTSQTFSDIYSRAETGDFNNDGFMDIALSDGTNSSVIIRLNDGMGNFGTPITVDATGGYSFTVADFNGDGFDDILSNSGNVYINNQNNTFTSSYDFSATFGPQQEVGDVDGDGDLDLIVLNGTNPKIYLNNGDGTAFTLNDTFAQQQTYAVTNSAKFGDFDGDGDLDVIVGSWEEGGTTSISQQAEIWENNGDGTFTFSNFLNNSYLDGGANDSDGATQDIEVADLDGDGDLDIFLNNRYGPNIVYKNDGDNNLTFTKAGTYGTTDVGPNAGPNDRLRSSIGDLDGDGDLDIISAQSDGTDMYLINDGTGVFTNINNPNTITTYTNDSSQSAIGDFNNDGVDDVFRTSSTAGHSEVLINNLNAQDYCYNTDVPINPFSVLTITDADSTNLSRVQVKINGFLSGDGLVVMTPGSLTVAYDGTNGILEISGNDTLANYQTALQSIQFTSTVDGDATRVLEMTVYDEYGTTSKTGALINMVNTDPIVIDLDGDGVELVSGANGVEFDINADGTKEQTGWAGMDDGILAFDVNGDGQINDMSEMISHYFAYQDHNAATNPDSSMEVLAQFDDNSDGVIDAEDEIFDGLSVWQDADGDGETDAGELLTLADQGIESIDLGYDTASEENEGNLITKEGNVTFEDGTQSQWQEVNFALDNTPSSTLEVGEANPLGTENTTWLLKEIVGTEQDVDTSVLPQGETTQSATLTLTSSTTTQQLDTSILAPNAESYTSASAVEDTSAQTVQAAE